MKKINSILKSQNGVSLIFVLVFMLVFFAFTGSVMLVATTWEGNVIKQTHDKALYYYTTSIGKVLTNMITTDSAITAGALHYDLLEKAFEDYKVENEIFSTTYAINIEELPESRSATCQGIYLTLNGVSVTQDKSPTDGGLSRTIETYLNVGNAEIIVTCMADEKYLTQKARYGLNDKILVYSQVQVCSTESAIDGNGNTIIIDKPYVFDDPPLAVDTLGYPIKEIANITFGIDQAVSKIKWEFKGYYK